VGKSTLFNRLIGSRQAVVDDEPGVTRDRVYGQVDWNGVRFELIDTGGYVPDSSDRFEEAIRDQVDIAIAEADLILLTVDVMVGVTDLDESVGNMLQRTDRPVLVVANKADNEERRWQAHEFYSLGFEEVVSVSSTNGTGTGELLDRIAESFDATEGTPPEEDDRDRIAIIGKPNVGKSSLVNALLREERAMVTEVSGTTRDSIDSVLQVGDREVVLVDTAGLRRRTRMEGNIEFYSSLRSERAIEQCDVAVLVVDAYEGLKNQVLP
jgi:GTP-binding protein